MAAWNPQANSIFLKAMDIRAGDDRAKYLGEACRGDEALRTEVESLLAARDHAGSFLESPPHDCRPTANSSATELA